MATKKVTSIINNVEFVPGNPLADKPYGDSYILSVDNDTKLPWLSQAFMDNWFSRKQVNPAFTPAQVMTDAEISWEERAVKDGDPVLDRKGNPVLDGAGNQVFYTKDHVRIENIVIAQNMFISEQVTKAVIKHVAKQQIANASPADRARQMLAEKKAAREAAAKLSASKQPTPAELTGEGEGFTPELSPEEQLAMTEAALALEGNPATV